MNEFLESMRKLRVRRSTIYLCVAWAAIFALYLAVKPEEPAELPAAVPVAPVTRTPAPTEMYEPTSTTTTSTTTHPTTTTTTLPGELNRTAPSTTTQVIPGIPNDTIPPGPLPAQPTPTPTPTETPR